MAGIKAVLFDMDGTILDTIEDLADCLNDILREYSFPAHSLAEVRLFVGNGIRKLIQRALPADVPAELADEVYRRYLSYYRTHCMVKTKPYDGIRELLEELKASGIKTAVVSNKADGAAKLLAEQTFGKLLDFTQGAAEGVKLKPDRQMIDIALEKLGVFPENAVYVGDSQVDVQTAANAGIKCISVTWGFRTREELLKSGAVMLADTPADVLGYVKTLGAEG